MSETLTYEKVLQMFAETDRKWAELRVQIAADRAEMKASSLEVDQKIKEVSQQLGYIGNNNGSVAEDYFFNSFWRNKDFAHQHFDTIERNKYIANSTRHAEFDLVMYSVKSVAIIEVKYKVHKNDIEKTLKKQAQFRELVSYAEGKTIYLGLAALSFPPEVESEALEAGIAVIKQVGENMVVLDERVKAF